MQAAQEPSVDLSMIRPVRQPTEHERAMEDVEENIDNLLAALVATRARKIRMDQAKLMRGLRGVADVWLGNNGEYVEQPNEVWARHVHDMIMAMRDAQPLSKGFKIPD